MAYYFDSHPKILHLGDTISEKENYRRKICAAGCATGDTEFWSEMFSWPGFEELRKGYPGNRLRRSLLKRSHIPAVRELLLSIPEHRDYAEYLTTFQEKALSSTEMSQLIFGQKRIEDVKAILSMGYVVKVLHISKHPLLYVDSYLRRNADKPGTMGWYLQAVKAAFEWAVYNGKTYGLKNLSDDLDYYHVDFSEFCKSSKRVLDSTCRFLDIDFSPKMLTPEKAPHLLIGSQTVVKSRFSGIREPKLRLGVHEKMIKRLVRPWVLNVTNKLGYEYTYPGT